MLPSISYSVRSASPTRRLPEYNPRPWTQDEYDMLQRLREHYCSWERIPDSLPGRSPEACRTRWEDSSCIPPGSHPNWVPEEDDILVASKSQGHEWQEIASKLPARTPDGCKNRWYEKHHTSSPKADPWYKSFHHPVSHRTSSGQKRRRSLQNSKRHVRGLDSTASRTTSIPSSQRHRRTAHRYWTGIRLPQLAPKPQPDAELETMSNYNQDQIIQYRLAIKNLEANSRKTRQHTQAEPGG